MISQSQSSIYEEKQFLGMGFNFKEKLSSLTNEINSISNSSFSQNDADQTCQNPQTIIKPIQLEVQKNKLKSDVSTTLETTNKFFLFLGRESSKDKSEIIVYEYMKQDGQNRSLNINGIKGEIVCMKAKYCKKLKTQNKESLMESKKKKSQSQKNSEEEPMFEIMLILSTSSGFLKTIRITTEFTQTSVPQIKSLKLDYASLVDICLMQSQYFHDANVGLILSSTNRVYLVNFDMMNLIGVYYPTLMACEVGRCLKINNQKGYFLQCCQNGYIVMWKFTQHALELIRKSNKGIQINHDSKVKSKKQYQTQSGQSLESFTPKQMFHNITPNILFHSATSSGIKCCQLYGSFLLIITNSGMLKLIALNTYPNMHINENQYCTLFEYQIEDGELVSDMKFFPQTMELFVSKSNIYEGTDAKSYVNDKLLIVKEFRLSEQVRRNQTDASRPYRPFSPNSIKNNIVPSILPKPKHNNNKRCFLERIIFNTQLQIQKVEKIYPSLYIDCIDSIQINESKEIIVLRGKEFYLIGSTEIFNFYELK